MPVSCVPVSVSSKQKTPLLTKRRWLLFADTADYAEYTEAELDAYTVKIENSVCRL